MRSWVSVWQFCSVSRASFAQTGPAPGSAIRTSGFKLVETLAVDATEAPRKVFHARLTIPATPGDFVLLYPKWIPGEHGPSGPVVDTAGIYFRVHQGADQGRRSPGIATRSTCTPSMSMFPRASPPSMSRSTSSLPPRAEASAPAPRPPTNSPSSPGTGWSSIPRALARMTSASRPRSSCRATGSGPALCRAPQPLPARSKFALASLTTLIDSPVLMGEYMKKLPLQEGKTPAHELDIAADSEAALADPAAADPGLRQPCGRSRRALRRAALPRLSLPAHPQQSRRPLRTGASRVATTAAWAKTTSPTTTSGRSAPACCRTNTPTPGTASTAVPPAWPRPNTNRRWKPICSGSTRASPNISATSSPDAAD